MALKYVKFQRGTPSEYQILKQRSLIEDNALYFIFDQGDSQGTLYLGDILISSVGQGSSISKLEDLSNVLIDNLEASNILMADSSGNWKNVSLSEVANLIASTQGLGFEVNENIFTLSAVSADQIPVLELNGFNTANEGAVPIKGVNGQLEWSSFSINELDSTVSNLEEAISKIDNKIAEQISQANHLSYQVIDNLDLATKSNIVYLFKDDSSTELNQYVEYMLVNGQLEELGSWEANLNNYATKTELQSISNALSEFQNNVQTNYATLNSITTSLNTFETDTIAKKYATIENLNAISGQLDNYVLKTVFDSTVGDITQLTNYSAEVPTNIVKELNNIYEHLVWQSISITN